MVGRQKGRHQQGRDADKGKKEKTEEQKDRLISIKVDRAERRS